MANVSYNDDVLKKIRLKNFKLHEDTSIEASRITVFIGPNNSGKSSIFQALLALQQASAPGSHGNCFLLPRFKRQSTTSDQPFLYPRPPFQKATIDLGEFRDVLRTGSNGLQIGADGELLPGVSATGFLREAGALSLSFDVHFRENRLVRHDGSVTCSFGESSPWHWDSETPSHSQQGRLAIGGAAVMLFSPVDNLQLVQFNLQPTGAPLSNERVQQFKGLSEFFTGAWGRLFDSLHPVLSLRGFEEWGYPTVEIPSTENLDRLVLSDRAVALTNALAADARLRTEISERLRFLVGIGMEFETAPGRRVKVWATSAKTGRPETLFVNEGTGANQLPFILVPVALARPGETVLMSEPEAHLHPKAQSELTAMLLEISRKAELQFFIETHSEHVLHTILNAVAKGELTRDDVALYYFQNKDGVAVAEKKEINQFGQVEGGLPDFFEQSLAELTDYLKALSKP